MPQHINFCDKYIVTVSHVVKMHFIYQGYSESNLQLAVNKTADEKKNYYIQEICTYLSYFSM